MKDKALCIFDDVCNTIELPNEEIKALHYREFKEFVEILLTEKQQYMFLDDRNREFLVSLKRINKVKAYIDSEDNIWRVQHKQQNLKQ